MVDTIRHYVLAAERSARTLTIIRDVDVKEPDGIALELLAVGFVAFDIWQARDAMPLQTPVKRRPRQVRDRGLQGVEAVAQRQERVPSEGDNHRLLGLGQDDGSGSVGPVFMSPTVARLRHFATVLGSIPSSRLSCASPQSRPRTDGGQAFDLRSLYCCSDSVPSPAGSNRWRCRDELVL